MANQKGPPPAPLQPHVVNKLLDLLSTDDDFRDQFQRDAHGALAQVGYQPSSDEAAASGCMQLQSGAQLASKQQIARDRTKIEKSLAMIQNFTNATLFVSE